ncbi:MAG TPA: hypothetical protein VM537_04515 [Anaerolineae bacterium]|nr:hypothetical protein [Anaerolineae bacterium]
MIPFLFTSARMLGYWDGRQQHQLMEGNFYGLTWNEEQAWVSWQRPHVNGTLIMGLDGEILDLPDLRNVHDILWSGGILPALGITDTGHDRVILVWWPTGSSREKEIVFPLRPEARDTLHLNSLWGYPRTLVLESGLGGIKGGYPARISDLYGESVVDIGAMFCHNIYIEDGVLYGCYKEGLESGFYRMPMGGEPELFPIPGNYFMRGLARGDGFFLFGRSVSVERDKRRDGDSAVLVTGDDLVISDIVNLKDTGQLGSVRLLDGDRAHNGLPFPNQEVLDDLE